MENKSHQTMRAVAIDEFGGIEKMKPRELPVPEVATLDGSPRSGGWRRGRRMGIRLKREGGFSCCKEFGMQPSFPYVLGFDGAGTVEEVGDDVVVLPANLDSQGLVF